MNKFFAFAFLLGFSISLMGQTKHAYSDVGQSDAEAKAILDKLRKKYDAYQSIEADFSISIEIPQQDEIVQEGTIAQAGDRYRVDLSDQSFICDGTSLWYHQISNNEVQINNAEDVDGEMLSPKDFMKIYEKEDFIYALVNQFVEKGVAIQQIEFKPTDKNSEYSKMRLTVDKRQNRIMRIKVFAKDGSRYTFKLKNLVPDKDFASTYFKFDASKFPGIHVEDLRID